MRRLAWLLLLSCAAPAAASGQTAGGVASSSPPPPGLALAEPVWRDVPVTFTSGNGIVPPLVGTAVGRSRLRVEAGRGALT